jgi:triphosphoribosyl-dephospho-CoA synthase
MRKITQLAQIACIWEACAPKPGNVNRYNDLADTSLEDYLLSAVAIGPAFDNAGRAGIGRTVFRAVRDTQRFVRSNTNLGIILLLAPLVKACHGGPKYTQAKDSLKRNMVRLRRSLNSVLNSLTVEDARKAYSAIRIARPGGLGQVSEADVSAEPTITLLQAMALAKDRDAIAREYVTDFAITFETGLPALRYALSVRQDFPAAIVQTFLTILKHVPDSLIQRKKGPDSALQVSRWAGEVLAKGGIFTRRGQARMAEMDHALRDATHSLNPGTTADLTTAAVFLALLELPDSY